MSFVVHRTSEPRSLSPSRSSLDLSRESTPGTVRPVSVLDSPVPSPSYIPSERRSDIVGKRRSNSVVFSSPLNPRPSVSGPAPSHKTLVISPNDTATKRLSTFFTGASQMSVSMRQRLRQNSESSTIQEVMQQMELLNRDFTVQISEYQDHINNVEGQNKTLSAENEDLKRRLRKLEYERARDVRQLEARLQKLERRYTDDFANIKEVHSTKTDDLLRTIEDLAAANGVYKATLQQHRIDIPVTLAGIEANVLVLPPSTVTARRDPGRSDRDFIEQHYRTVLNRPLHSDARITTALASIDQSLELMREQLVVTSQWYGNDLLTVLTGFTNDLPGPTDQESTLAKYHAQSTSPSGSKPPSPPCTVTPPPRLPTPDPTDGSDPLFSPKFDFRVTDSEGSRRTSTGSGRSAITLSAPTKCESTGLDSAVGGQSDGGDDDEDEGQATEELDTSDGGSSDGDGDDEFPTYPFAEITERRRPRSGFQPSLLVAKLEHLSLLQTGTTEPPAVEGPVSVPGQVWIAGNGAHNSPHRAAVTPEPVISSAHLVRSGPHSPYSLPERTETGPALTVGLSPSRTNGAYVPPPDGEPVHQVPVGPHRAATDLSLLPTYPPAAGAGSLPRARAITRHASPLSRPLTRASLSDLRAGRFADAPLPTGSHNSGHGPASPNPLNTHPSPLSGRSYSSSASFATTSLPVIHNTPTGSHSATATPGSTAVRFGPRALRPAPEDLFPQRPPSRPLSRAAPISTPARKAAHRLSLPPTPHALPVEMADPYHQYPQHHQHHQLAVTGRHPPPPHQPLPPPAAQTAWLSPGTGRSASPVPLMSYASYHSYQPSVELGSSPSSLH